ncbi:MAG TPA: sigma-70 family RNA polymerase sigma factor [Candidatus Coprenecus stercoravium]|uniref:Sigma-70 family RNA polymerase sigma factor n=1 Tax=Candidatus Coprenecus stercoravium TaxID=2840735 RepID=A0A9D2KAA3_9BACT|nr:sigma-70 family RNA polymerase sigma factor [Candidatus Coprenecus stercoravium]
MKDNKEQTATSAADENELAIKAMTGDTIAFSILASRYTEPLRNYIQGICSNATDAEDICQECLRKTYLNISQYNPEYQFKTWIFSIARNTAIDHLRRKSTFSTINIGETEEPSEAGHEVEASPEDNMIDGQSYDMFVNSVSSLPDKYRTIAELRLLHGYAYQEIADELSIPLNTVRTRIRRAKALLENMMKK